jgi:AAA family ATP:ADP antiporter
MGLAALASVAIPLALAWAALGIWLGRAQQRQVGRARAASTQPWLEPIEHRR